MRQVGQLPRMIVHVFYFHEVGNEMLKFSCYMFLSYLSIKDMCRVFLRMSTQVSLNVIHF